MNKKEEPKVRWIDFGIPIGIIALAVLLGKTSLLQEYPNTVSILITYTLTIVSPLVFLILIWEKKIFRLTAIPFFTIGIILVRFLLLEEQRVHLEVITTYLLPVIEILAILYIVYKSYMSIKSFRANAKEDADRYMVFKKTAYDMVENRFLTNFLASEIAYVNYAFFEWRTRALKDNEFTCYKKSGVTSVFGGIIFVVLLETIVLHLILYRYDLKILAWVFTFSSLYVAMLIFGHLKSMKFRFSKLKEDQLILRYGLFGDARINLDMIEKVESTTKDVDIKEKKVAKLAMISDMEDHNIALYFKEKQKVEGAYGIIKECDVLLLYIDEKKHFLETLNQLIQQAEPASQQVYTSASV
ncbi:hypothetical protein [Aquimarina aquimarini]|uniref:hypothetical protein n=1 Tax=Aquimarina aquimarini TaxID=1191734 RepID=UPI000D54E7A8|nr:hypothetical protein [Aquimarina aquimarini]